MAGDDDPVTTGQASPAPLNLPHYPNFVPVKDPTVASLWDEWVSGLECMLAAMLISNGTHKYHLLNLIHKKWK